MTQEVSDDKETIERASRESGAKELVEELARKMRKGQGQGRSSAENRKPLKSGD